MDWQLCYHAKYSDFPCQSLLYYLPKFTAIYNSVTFMLAGKPQVHIDWQKRRRLPESCLLYCPDLPDQLLRDEIISSH